MDNEIKSTYNKAKNLDGYNGESELHLTQMLTPNWGLDAGARWEMESRETSEEQAFTEAIIGARFKFPTLDMDYSGLISYRPHINSGNTDDDVTLGTFEFLFKASSYLSRSEEHTSELQSH